MKKDNLLIAFVVFAVLLFGTAIASAGPIAISNTGFGTYTVAGPNIITPSNPAVIASPYPSSAWAAAPSGASWIAPNADQTWDPPQYHSGSGSLPGDWTYITTFSLSFNPGTAVLAGYWGTDNGGTMSLNGNQVAVLGPPPPTFQSLNYFSITNPLYFQAGTNTLTFVVNNEDGRPNSWAGSLGENPTGLLVEFTQATVPEPSLILLLGIGLGAVTLLTQRWRI
jgi:hypothetical protein